MHGLVATDVSQANIDTWAPEHNAQERRLFTSSVANPEHSNPPYHENAFRCRHFIGV
jgi:hypothetical protein